MHLPGLLRRLAAIAALAMAPLLAAHAATPVQRHGALAVKGNKVVDAQGKPLSLAGPSLFWSNSGWEGNGGRFYHPAVVRYVKQDWHAGIIRAAIGADATGGYQSHPAENFARLEAVVDAAIAEGLYVIVDFHSHDAQRYPEVAVQFFGKVARKYGRYPNLIYEIYNEPLDTTDWATQIKPYAERVIASIRAIDPDNLIVVGTQTWSQDVDKAAADPLTGVHNVAYALHFYAGTHKQALRDKAVLAMNKGLALMVTEWGAVNADGDGGLAKEETERWLAFMREHQLTHLQWAFSDKKEGASQLKPGTDVNAPWSAANLSEAGLYIRGIVRDWGR